MFFFLLSVGLTLFTVSLLLRRVAENYFDRFFLFFPTFFFYLSGIIFLLSFIQSVEKVPFLLCQLTIAGAVLLVSRRQKVKQKGTQGKRYVASFFNFLKDHDLLSLFLVTLVISTVLLSLYAKLHFHVLDYDDATYRVSAPLYWLQNKSMFFFPTYDLRQNIFVFASGILLLWPMMFTVNFIGISFFYWLAFPFSVVSLVLLVKYLVPSLKKNYHYFLILLYLTIPMIFNYFSFSFSQESWLSLCLLSLAYFAIKITRDKKERISNWLGLGWVFGSVLIMKPTAWVFLLPVIAVWFMKAKSLASKKASEKLSYLFLICISILIYLVGSGYLFKIYQNHTVYGTPFGDRAWIQYHASNGNREKIINLVRSPLLLLEPPLFSQTLSNFWANKVNDGYLALYKWLHVSEEYYPGQQNLRSFQYIVREPNALYSLSGCIWLAAFIFLVIHFFKQRLKTSLDLMVVLSFFISGLSIAVLLNWQLDASPILRHLVSLMPVIIAFFSLFFPFVRHFPKYLISIVAIYMLLVFNHFFFTALSDIQHDTLPEAMIFPICFDNSFPQLAPVFNDQNHPKILVIGNVFEVPDAYLFRNQHGINNLIPIQDRDEDGFITQQIISYHPSFLAIAENEKNLLILSQLEQEGTIEKIIAQKNEYDCGFNLGMYRVK